MTNESKVLSMDKTLKPCPFCGYHAYVVDKFPKLSNCHVQCSNCFARTDEYFTRADAVKAWNKRAEKSNTNINSEAWNDALRMLLKSVSSITKLIESET